MAIDPIRPVVLNYDEETQWLNIQTIDPVKLAPLLVGLLKMPILLDDFDFRLDDEFARRLGVAMLNAISLGQPDITQYMTVAQEPIDRP